jgi:hypothetical protein
MADAHPFGKLNSTPGSRQPLLDDDVLPALRPGVLVA